MKTILTVGKLKSFVRFWRKRQLEKNHFDFVGPSEKKWKIVFNFLPFSLQYLDFKIQVESTQPFTILDAGYNYSHAGLRLYFVRYKIGGLMSGFFGPTGLFALLSMISFGISPEVVRNVHDLIKRTNLKLCFDRIFTLWS